MSGIWFLLFVALTFSMFCTSSQSKECNILFFSRSGQRNVQLWKQLLIARKIIMSFFPLTIDIRFFKELLLKSTFWRPFHLHTIYHVCTAKKSCFLFWLSNNEEKLSSINVITKQKCLVLLLVIKVSKKWWNDNFIQHKNIVIWSQHNHDYDLNSARFWLCHTSDLYGENRVFWSNVLNVWYSICLDFESVYLA